MYWKVSEHIDDHKNSWIVYNYIAFVKRNNVAGPWYNGLLKEWKYPQVYEVIVKAAMAASEEDFLSRYNKIS